MKLFTIIASLTLFTETLLADIDRINHLVGIVKSNRYFQHLNTDSGAKNYLLQSDGFKNLKSHCGDNWHEITENLELIESSEDRMLLFWGMAEVPPNDYLQLLDNLTSKFEEGEISDFNISNILFPAGLMKAFTVDNYDDEAIIGILERVKSKTDDAALKKRLTDTLSGKAKKTLDDYREAHSGLPEGEIPRVILNDKKRKTHLNQKDSRVAFSSSQKNGSYSKNKPTETNPTNNPIPIFWIIVGGLLLGMFLLLLKAIKGKLTT